MSLFRFGQFRILNFLMFNFLFPTESHPNLIRTPLETHGKQQI
jgi:hypothetical protein